MAESREDGCELIGFDFVTVQESWFIFKKKQLFALKYTLKHLLVKID